MLKVKNHTVFIGRYTVNMNINNQYNQSLNNNAKITQKSQTSQNLLNAQNQFIDKYFNSVMLNNQPIEYDTRTMKQPLISKDNFINSLNFDIKSLSKLIY